MINTRVASVFIWLVVLFTPGVPGLAWGVGRPNFIFIFADDQCFETLSGWGHPVVRTPNLDRLVDQGLSFSHAYNMGSWSGAVCVASRTMLNTGRSLWRAHAVVSTLERERMAGRMWSELLRQVGYRTYMSGKWHVQCDPQAAFDVARHIRPGMPNQTPQGYDRPQPDGSDPWSPSDPRFGGYWQGGRHWSEVLADDAISFLQATDGHDEPFFMYLAFNAPHDPRQSPQEFVDRYPADRIRIPTNFSPDYPFKDTIGCGPELRDERLAPFPRTEYAVQVHRREYYAQITHLDQQIGRILDALGQSRRRRNTYVIYTADHGLAVGHHGLFGKQNMYDHSVRVPFILVGPDIPAGELRPTPIYLQDAMPTTLDLAGVPRPEHVEFKSLVPLIHDESRRPYEAIYGAYLQLQRMVSWGGYKLIAYPQARRLRLYHVARDPDETTDLISDPSYGPLVRELFARLLELQEQMDDPLELRTVFPDWL